MQRVRGLVEQGVDWEGITQTALRHCVFPLLYDALNKVAPEMIPEAVRERLRVLFNRNARRNFALTGELFRILDLLQAHGVPACPYRGPVLAASAYGDTSMRQFDDLDLLLHQRDVLRARDVLLKAGFRTDLDLNPAQQTAYFRAQSELKLLNEEGAVIVELHWAVTECYFSFPLDAESLWPRLVPVCIDGKTILTLSPEDLLLILCAHGTKHVWRRLGWICDLSRLLSTSATIDWQGVLSQARALRSERMLLLGLALANHLLGAPLPECINSALCSDPKVTKLAEKVRRWLFLEPGGSPGNWATALFHLRARESLRDRLRYCVLLTATTTPGDWAAVPLPSRLFPLYYVLRPFRLLAGYALGWHRRSC